MKKYILSMLVLCLALVSYSQEKNIKTQKKGDLTEVTYYHDNGEVSQIGYFNKLGKLQDTWKQFDLNGNKLAVGNYNNGKKVGVWFFWINDELKQVDYQNNKIKAVSQWKDKKRVVYNY